jgi:hypothetical protein
MPDQRSAILQLREQLPYIAELLERPMSNAPMKMTSIPVNTILWDEPVTFIFSYQVPQDFKADGLHDELELNVRDKIYHMTTELNALTKMDKFNAAEVTDKQHCDGFEAMLAPRVGDIAHRFKAPLFRYNVRLRRAFNHDVEIGE